MRDERPREGQQTMWGRVQFVEDIAPGIWFAGTASHGGVKLSRERQRELPAELRQTWYEEDCEYLIPAIAFYQEFKAGRPLADLIESCRYWHGDDTVQLLMQGV